MPLTEHALGVKIVRKLVYTRNGSETGNVASKVVLCVAGNDYRERLGAADSASGTTKTG